MTGVVIRTPMLLILLLASGVMAAEDPTSWEHAPPAYKVPEGMVFGGAFMDRMSAKICGEKHGGVHAVSRDGVACKLGKPLQSWSRSIVWDDGRMQVLGSLERPYLLFQNGKPTHLLGAVADGPGGFTRASQTWDMVISLKAAP